MNFTGLFCLLIAQFLSGCGLVRLFRLQLTQLASICLSLMTGVMLVSLIPCALELVHIPLTSQNVAIGIGVSTLLWCIPLFLPFKKITIGKIQLPKLYEIPFFLVFLFLIATSIWRCFYFPPTPRDVLAGSELIAEFAVKEQTMINSVYNVDLHTTNNQFKSPFLTTLQIIYKMFVTDTGQVWLSTLSVPFIVWLYSVLRERVHAIIACMLLLMFFAVPDVFAYSYIMLYDYSAMVFFFAGFYFITRHIKENRTGDLAFSAMLFGIATYIRVETLVLVGFVSLMPAWYSFRNKVRPAKIAINAGILMSASVFFYILCMNVFVKNFVPQTLDTAGQMNKNLADVSVFFTRLSDINEYLIFSNQGKLVYGYFLYVFMFMVVVDAAFTRRFSKDARMALYGVAVVYFGLAFLGYLLPLFDIMNTTKRGMFKAIPLISLYLSSSSLVQLLSNYLIRKESGIKDAPVAKPAPTPRPQQPPAAKRKARK